ncbi:MAG: enoyl-CoA hydratase/isomerase family protein [Hyphomicrobiales bacterium]|nr:enoyl-CoA hydratase/isomerase family protein [Hyphomicrobiales bacterium]
MSEISTNANLVLIREEGRAGLITLNNPKMLNALTHDMLAPIHAAYIKWASTPRVYGIVLDAVPGRAFCAGGDIRAMAQLIKSDLAVAEQFFRDEYQHNWALECFTKPNVSLINGFVMGGGAGLSRYGTHRVAGENFVFAMPETKIGFFPDVGGTYFLPRFPGETGMYLGLTGASIDRADAYCTGFATHCIDSSQFDLIREAMIEGSPVDAVLDGLHRNPGDANLARMQPVIDRIFAADSVEGVMSRLDAESGVHAHWAAETAANLRQRCPLSLKVAYRALREGGNMESLRDDLHMEYRLTSRFLRGGTMYEGVRAALIDKDNKPVWQPAELSEVSDAMVDAYFAPLGDGELELKDYWKLVV